MITPDMAVPSRPADDQTAVVLIVDDAPENLAMLHEALDTAGYRVLVAIDGPSALSRVARLHPDVILLDAVMPGMDGFETCRRLKADPMVAHIPVVFMTGLADAEHIVEGFRAGGVDYVTKPIETSEMLARIATHLGNARQTAHAQRAVDATGHAMLSVSPDGRVRWLSPSAREWLRPCLDDEGLLPPEVIAWLQRAGTSGATGATTLPGTGSGTGTGSGSGSGSGSGPVDGSDAADTSRPESFRLMAGDAQLSLSRLAGDTTALTLLVRRVAAVPGAQTLAAAFALTTREAEVLHWVVLGKTNRDVGDILGMSPRTVDKHLQHVFAKLNVETRTAAASLVLKRLADQG